MAGLVGYDSSGEEDEERLEPPVIAPPSVDSSTKTNAEILQHQVPPDVTPGTKSAVPLEPSLLLSMEASAIESDWFQPEGSASPYSANRALIHDLTLPTIPNLDIPPSTESSPPARATKTFEQFLALKKKGTHFNAKLERSTALRNPSVMDKLMDYVGLSEQQQYETTLSRDLWDPAAFPETAYFEKLRKSREKIAKQREVDKVGGARSLTDFVPSVGPNNTNAPAAGGLSKPDKTRSSWK